MTWLSWGASRGSRAAVGRLWLAAGVVALGAGAAPVRPLAAEPDPLAACEAAFAAAPEERESVRCFRRVGGRPEHAAEVVRRLEALRARHPDHPWLPYDLAAVLWPTHSPRVAELYAEAARLFAERGDVEGQIDAHRGRIIALGWQERHDEIGRELATLERLADASDDPDLAMQVRVGLARHHLDRRADPQTAWQLLQEDAARVAAGRAEARREGSWRRMAAKVAHELGRFPQARRHLRRWLEIEEEHPDPYGRASALEMLARIHLSSAVPSPAAREQLEDLLRRSLEAARASDNRATEALVRGFLGRLLGGERGRGHLQACVELARGLGEEGAPEIEVPCLTSLAVLRAPQDEAEARRLLERAGRRARAAGDPWTASLLDVEGMRVDWATRPRGETLARAEATIGELEARLLEQTSGEEIRARMRSRWLDPHYWVAGRLLQGDPDDPALGPDRQAVERAFRMIEGRRGRSGADRPGSPAAATRPSGRPPSLLGAVEGALAEGEALLVFLMGDWENLYGEFEGGAWLLAVTSGGTRVHPLPGRAALEGPVERLAGLDDPQGSPALLARLHRQLLEPALAELPAAVDHLILLPDLPLHALPFAALAAEGQPPLAARFHLSQVASASRWLLRRNQSRRLHPLPALVVADPHPPAAEGRAAAAIRGAPGPGLVVPAQGEGATLGPLPHARREGRTIRRLLGPGTELLVGEEASEDAFLGLPLGSFAVLHLAAHAVADPYSTAGSAVFLAPGGGRDGRLTPREIEGLPLDDAVVVLAACETAAGEAVRGEGVLSLARAFLDAGAATVVASRWRLPDAEAAELFGELYQGLRRGESVVQALDHGRRRRLSTPGTAPLWAGLIVLGEGRHTPFPGGLRNPGWLPWLAGGILGLLVLAGWALRYRSG